MPSRLPRSQRGGDGRSRPVSRCAQATWSIEASKYASAHPSAVSSGARRGVEPSRPLRDIDAVGWGASLVRRYASACSDRFVSNCDTNNAPIRVLENVQATGRATSEPDRRRARPAGRSPLRHALHRRSHTLYAPVGGHLGASGVTRLSTARPGNQSVGHPRNTAHAQQSTVRIKPTVTCLSRLSWLHTMEGARKGSRRGVVWGGGAGAPQLVFGGLVGAGGGARRHRGRLGRTGGPSQGSF